MWDYADDAAATNNRYLVLAFTSEPASGTAERSPHADLIAFGPPLPDDGAQLLGAAALLQSPDSGDDRDVLDPDRYAGVEVHHWRFGGRPCHRQNCADAPSTSSAVTPRHAWTLARTAARMAWQAGVVMADPDGNEFCVLRPLSSRELSES
jgi:hypothetical protein